MKKQPAEFAALLGIDWADRKHDLCLEVAGTARRERSVLEHRPTLRMLIEVEPRPIS